MRDEKFDEYYFDKKKHHHIQGGSRDDSKNSKGTTELSEGLTRGHLSNPGISDFSRGENFNSRNREGTEIKASSKNESGEQEQHGWVHGSDEKSYQPNNLESEYYENTLSRELGQTEIKLYEDILEKIMDTPDINARDVKIKVDQTRVILSGEVDTRKMKEMIADIAKYTEGVNQVVNDIVIRRRS